MKEAIQLLVIWAGLIGLWGFTVRPDMLLSLDKSFQLREGKQEMAVIPNTGAIYYISANGDDRNKGTIDSPWKTLQHAADHVAPDSTVFVRGGVYHQKLHITRGGSETEGAIVFSGYPNETAVLDGEGLPVDEMEGLVEIDNASYVTIRQLEIRNYTTSASGKVPAGIYIHGTGKRISLLENRIHGIANMSIPEGDELSGRDAHGIAVYGTETEESISDLTIDGNELYDLVLGSSESLVLNGNVEHFAITNNRIHDNDNIGIDLIGFEGIAGSEAVDQARNGTVKGNTVYGISTNHNPSYGIALPNGSYSAGGIYVDGGRNILIEQNRIYSNDIGIELASEHAGHVTSSITVQDNLIYRNRLTGIAMGGYDEDRGGTTTSTVVSNTLYKNDLLQEGNGQLYLQAFLSGNTITHNILVASESNVMIYNEYKSNTDNVVDHNLYYSESSAEEVEWIWKNKVYAGFAAYQKKSGNDPHSLFADPKFVDPDQGDFRLLAGSPAQGKGRNESAK
ncbi:right-handed parallel beta-helix repeat-containing protein [Paenibacillus sp. M1]|uniref:Right-handed parallel beta-helix repeat-containing protein n=1 Tax=Paenibacillus haidiansis TaxID=1574488 RepID=A0ABU7VY25_9BACL